MKCVDKDILKYRLIFNIIKIFQNLENLWAFPTILWKVYCFLLTASMRYVRDLNLATFMRSHVSGWPRSSYIILNYVSSVNLHWFPNWNLIRQIFYSLFSSFVIRFCSGIICLYSKGSVYLSNVMVSKPMSDK